MTPYTGMAGILLGTAGFFLMFGWIMMVQVIDEYYFYVRDPAFEAYIKAGSYPDLLPLTGALALTNTAGFASIL